jgi:hypothetical protein
VRRGGHSLRWVAEPEIIIIIIIIIIINIDNMKFAACMAV